MYFGCFLNVYDPTVNFLRVGTHHCLLAEISYVDYIVASNGNTPSPENCAQLAQRNLSIAWAENPGPATKLVPQTFDLRPSAVVTGTDVPPELARPDELLIDWGNTPPGSTASIYWPQVNASDVISLASQLYGSNYITQVDPQTFSIQTVAGVSWIPIPARTGENFAGLFTVDLPSTITDGQQLNIVVKRLSTQSYTQAVVPQIGHPSVTPNPPILSTPSPTPVSTATNQPGFIAGPPAPANPPIPPSPYDPIYWRYVVGSFSLSIPVTKAANILPIEMDTLAIFKYRLEHMPTTDRWYPVLLRYVGILSSRVNGLGGNAGLIPGNPTGAPPGMHGGGGVSGHGGDCGCCCCHSCGKDHGKKPHHHHCKSCEPANQVVQQTVPPNFNGTINIFIDAGSSRCQGSHCGIHGSHSGYHCPHCGIHPHGHGAHGHHHHCAARSNSCNYCCARAPVPQTCEGQHSYCHHTEAQCHHPKCGHHACMTVLCCEKAAEHTAHSCEQCRGEKASHSVQSTKGQECTPSTSDDH